MPRRCVALLLALALCAAFPAVTLAAWGPCAAAPAVTQPRPCCCEKAGRACAGCGCAATPGPPETPVAPATPVDAANAPSVHDAFLPAPALPVATVVLPRLSPEPPSAGAITEGAGPLFLSVCSLRR